MDVRSLPNGRTGALRLELRNTGTEDVVLRARAIGYAPDESEDVQVPAGGVAGLDWPTDQGWYDVEVTTAQDPSFRRRVTGRVENGAPGVTG